MNGHREEYERLRRLLVGDEPVEVRDYLMVPSDETVRIAGTGAVAILPPGFTQLAGSGLFLPSRGVGPGPLDFAGAYVTLPEYMDFGLPPDQLVKFFALARSREDLLVALAHLNGLVENDVHRATLTAEFRELLQPEVRARFDTLFSTATRGGRRLTSRQPILAAMKTLFDLDVEAEDEATEQGGEARAPSLPLFMVAILFAQAVAATLAADPEDESETIIDRPAHLVLELVRVSFLHEWTDYYAAIGRVRRLWREFGERLVKYQLRESPVVLLERTLGMELETFIAFGFLLLAHSMQWDPTKPPYLNRELGSDAPEELKVRFLELVSDDLDGFKARFEGHKERFDFLPLEQTPVLDGEHGLVVLDQGFLWQRITSGLYWVVHDSEKARSEDDRVAWTQAYGEMVELMVEDQVRRFAPKVLSGGSSVYTEEDFASAYEGKVSDIGVDFGHVILLVEVVSGQVTVPTRVDGSKAKFLDDTEKLVMKKCRQLDETARAILDDQAALPGHVPVPGLRIIPLVVTAEGYPLNPFTSELVRSLIMEEGLFQHAMIEPVGVISVAELDSLEGLAEAGLSVVDLLDGWKRSALADLQIGTYLATNPETNRIKRSPHIEAAARQVFDEMIPRLRLRDAPDAEDGSETGDA